MMEIIFRVTLCPTLLIEWDMWGVQGRGSVRRGHVISHVTLKEWHCVSLFGSSRDVLWKTVN